MYLYECYMDIKKDHIAALYMKTYEQNCFQILQPPILFKYGHCINPVCRWASPDSLLTCSVEILKSRYNAASLLEQRVRIWNAEYMDGLKVRVFSLNSKEGSISVDIQHSKQHIDSNTLCSYYN